MHKNSLYFWHSINKLLKERGVIQKAMKNIDELKQNLIKAISILRHDDEKMHRVAEKLTEFDVSTGKTMQYLVHAEKEIPNLDIRLLCLLTEQVYNQSADADIVPTNYFSELDIKKSKQYSGENDRKEEAKLPYTFHNVLMIDQENYVTVVNVQEIKKLMDSKLLRYNRDTQREARQVKRQGKIEKEVNINKKSVREIAEHLLNGTLVSTLITFNCLAGTSDEGDEVVYNAKKQELTITEGTLTDILDGMHRIVGVLEALSQQPELEFTFQLAIKNYNTRTAQQYVGQINTVNQMAESRLKELKESRYSDTIVKILQRQSELRGKIAQTNRPSIEMGQQTSFSLLSDTIDEVFKIDNKREAMDIADYLVEFFDYLVGSFPDEFSDNAQEHRKDSIINSNVMYASYIVLAKRFKDENIKLKKLTDIIKNIDFSRDNEEWAKLGILENRRANASSRKRLMKYFKNLNIG